jgi:hypothetical protein
LQVAQLVAGQVLQVLPMPSIELNSPPSLLEKAVKRENNFLAGAWQLGQEVASSAWLKERLNSNLALQLGQRYS